MKINPTTAAAVAFAAFAAWYALKPGAVNKVAATAAKEPAAIVWDTLASQRLQVGDSLQQNGAYLDQWVGYSFPEYAEQNRFTIFTGGLGSTL